MARYPRPGFIAGSPNPLSPTSITVQLTVWTIFNPVGDWNQLYMQAHPDSAFVRLESDLHAKSLVPDSTGTNRYFYRLTTTNRSAGSTGWAIDM
jgi:hypothetical protein